MKSAHVKREDLFGRRSLRDPSKPSRSHKRSVSSSNEKHQDHHPSSLAYSNNATNISVQKITSSPDSKKKDIYHHEPKEFNLEIVDANRRSLPTSLDKNKNLGSSLFEWEALQRQKLEEEEKNRINKLHNPVSSKIKDLVKTHSGFISIFSKDRKGDYNGTVDAKDEIMFRKIPNESSQNVVINDISKPMKSPYIVQSILSPKPCNEQQPKLQEANESARQPEKNISSSLERKAYMFNQRNIYIDNDTIDRKRDKIKISTSHIQNIVGKRVKKFEVTENIIAETPKAVIKERYIYNSPSNNKVNSTFTYIKPEVKVSNKQEWVNNMLNKLSNESNSYIKETKDRKVIANNNERNALHRRSFHESSFNKKDESSKKDIGRNTLGSQINMQKHLTEIKFEKRKKESNISGAFDHMYKAEKNNHGSYASNTSSPIYKQKNQGNNILHSTTDNVREHDLNKSKSFQPIQHSKSFGQDADMPAPPPRQHGKKLKGRGPVNLISIIGDSSSSNNSTPFTSPRTSPERHIPNAHLLAPISETKIPLSKFHEKENVSPFAKNRGLTSSNEKLLSPTPLEDGKNRYYFNYQSYANPYPNYEEKRTKQRTFSQSSEPNSVFESNEDLSRHCTSPRFQRERSNSLRSNHSILSGSDRGSRPVSLSSILEDNSTRANSKRISPSKELEYITQTYRKERDASRKDKKETINTNIKENKPSSKSNNIERVSPSKSKSKTENLQPRTSSTYKPSNKLNPKEDKYYSTTRTIKKQVKESHVYNTDSNKSSEKKERKPKIENSASKHSSSRYGMVETTKPRPKLVRRRSSLKKYSSGDITSSVKKDPKLSKSKPTVTSHYDIKRKDSDTASEIYESIRHKPGVGWTKTNIRRVKLGRECTPEKNPTKEVRDKTTFKSDASKELENWASGMQVQGKLVKKEGQKYSRHVEEEVQNGKKTSKAVSRRVVRRGSRRLSTGGEMLSETKEITAVDPSTTATSTALVPSSTTGPQPPSRKIKSSTDGERYVTQSVTTEGGRQKLTTEGVDNNTTNSVEVIGGKGWEGERAVKGRHGERLIVEHGVGPSGRSSTVVKKSTSQSKFIITKTKRKMLRV